MQVSLIVMAREVSVGLPRYSDTIYDQRCGLTYRLHSPDSVRAARYRRCTDDITGEHLPLIRVNLTIHCHHECPVSTTVMVPHWCQDAAY